MIKQYRVPKKNGVSSHVHGQLHFAEWLSLRGMPTSPGSSCQPLTLSQLIQHFHMRQADSRGFERQLTRSGWPISITPLHDAKVMLTCNMNHRAIFFWETLPNMTSHISGYAKRWQGRATEYNYAISSASPNGKNRREGEKN